jgi:hypothetical protein
VSFWQKLFGLLAIVALLVLAQIGMHLHRWYRFGEERVVLQDLRERGTDVGVDVIRSRARADTLSRTVAALDEELERRVAELRAFEEHMEGRRLPRHLYGSYRERMDRFERVLRDRDRAADEWRRQLDENRRAVIRYNAIVDSVRMIGASIGEPYYPIPNPAEAAAERGILAPPDDGEPRR